MKKYFKQHLSEVLLIVFMSFIFILLIIYIYKSFIVENNDKHYGDIATIISILFAPFVQNYFFNKQSKQNIKLADKQYVNNINAGFSQRLYIYKYDDLKNINKNLLNFYSNIIKINNIMNELDTDLNPIWGSIPKNYDRRTLNYDISKGEINEKMRLIVNLSLSAIRNIQNMHSNIKLSEIIKKNNLLALIEDLEKYTAILKQSSENIPLNMNSMYYKNKEARNDNVDELINNIKIIIKHIEYIYNQCADEINTLKLNIRQKRTKQ